jgi:Holliday junction resolvase RusA-like endonuclease
VTVVCEITVPGEPGSKARPRVTRTRGTYTPRATVVKEDEIGWTLKAAGVRRDTEHTFSLDLTFRCGTHRRKDLDNMVKLVLDACNDVAWADDDQAVAVAASVERGSANPGFDLRLSIVGSRGSRPGDSP